MPQAPGGRRRGTGSARPLAQRAPEAPYTRRTRAPEAPHTRRTRAPEAPHIKRRLESPPKVDREVEAVRVLRGILVALVAGRAGEAKPRAPGQAEVAERLALEVDIRGVEVGLGERESRGRALVLAPAPRRRERQPVAQVEPLALERQSELAIALGRHVRRREHLEARADAHGPVVRERPVERGLRGDERVVEVDARVRAVVAIA